MGKSSSRSKGSASEKSAINFLINKGYLLISKNFYTRFGEIDIIMKDGLDFVFVEVKSLDIESGYSIYETITQKKRSRIQKAVNMWLLEQNKLDVDYRIDFIGIIKKDKKILDIIHEKFI